MQELLIACCAAVMRMVQAVCSCMAHVHAAGLEVAQGQNGTALFLPSLEFGTSTGTAPLPKLPLPPTSAVAKP